MVEKPRGVTELSSLGLIKREIQGPAPDTRGWSDEAFRDLMTYCQAADYSACAFSIISLRDNEQCSVEATYRIIDLIVENDESFEALNGLMRVVLHPAGDCLGYTIPDDE